MWPAANHGLIRDLPNPSNSVTSCWRTSPPTSLRSTSLSCWETQRVCQLLHFDCITIWSLIGFLHCAGFCHLYVIFLRLPVTVWNIMLPAKILFFTLNVNSYIRSPFRFCHGSRRERISRLTTHRKRNAWSKGQRPWKSWCGPCPPAWFRRDCKFQVQALLLIFETMVRMTVLQIWTFTKLYISCTLDQITNLHTSEQTRSSNGSNGHGRECTTVVWMTQMLILTWPSGTRMHDQGTVLLASLKQLKIRSRLSLQSANIHHG